MMAIFDEFKAFILRGNVVELAVAVVIGTAFKGVVDSMVADLLTPLLGALFGEPDFSALDFTINDSRFTYGNFINALISFLMVAAAIFFFVVKPMNMLVDRMKKEEVPPEDTPEEIVLLREIRDSLRTRG
jgi:large conductance mechanosensitive channel